MKKALFFVCCVVAFLLIAAPTAVEHHKVFVNGKPFATAAVINGQFVVALEDFAKAAGAKVTLEPSFQLQGSKLTAVWTAEAASTKIKNEVPLAAKKSTPDLKIKIENKASGTQIFQVARAGEISSKVFMDGGKAWIPLHDLAKAFGANFTAAPGALRPTDSINLVPKAICDGCVSVAR